MMQTALVLDLPSLPGKGSVYLFPVNSHSFTKCFSLSSDFPKTKQLFFSFSFLSKMHQQELVIGVGLGGAEANSKQSQTAGMVTLSAHAERTYILETCDPAELSHN